MAQISIIIPCFHAELYLTRALKSLLSQTFHDWEAVIVSDDGVDYRLIVTAQGLCDPRFAFTSTGQIGLGPAKARNAGIAVAQSPLIAPLDMDDALAPTYLETLIPLTRQHGFVFAHYAYLDDKTDAPIDPAFKPLVPEGTLSIQHLPLALLCHTHVCVLYDRECIPITYRTDMPLCEDTLLPFQAYEYVDTIYKSNAPLYHYYRRYGSITQSPDTFQRYVAAKQMLIRAIEDKTLLQRHPSIARVALDYLNCSLEAEKAYGQAIKDGQNVSFISFNTQRWIDRFAAAS